MNIFTNIQYQLRQLFSGQIYQIMNYTQKIYFIIQERKGACLPDLIEITKYKKITVLRAISKLLITRKILSLDYLGTKFFVINSKKI